MKFYLRETVLDDKKEILEMVEEIENDTIEEKFEGLSNFEGLSANNYEDFIEQLQKNKNNKIYNPNLVNQTTYLLVDENNHIYGGTNIRHELNNNLLRCGGNIGYLIRPIERGKKYGNLILNLGLEECRKNGLDKVLVCCREENIASKKVIEKNGGIYENSLQNKENNKIYRRYWINIK